MHRFRDRLLWGYAVLTLLSAFFLTRLTFSFEFEQFFPQGDPEYQFFKEYIEEFENDDNFLLVALGREAGVFEQDFLRKVENFSIKAADLPHVTSVTSLTQLQYPLRTPFGITTVPAIHIEDSSYYATDREKALQDRRIVHNLLSEDATALTVVLKTKNRSTLEEARALMQALESLLREYQFESSRILGRAAFQRDLVWMQQREVLVSTLIAALLTMAVLFFIFRRWATVFIALGGIGLALLFFMGVLSALGRELNALSALYPILMCIVGVADTIHITTKYLDELEKGKPPGEAIRITIREVGLATFITCVTTAIGFASLLTNRTAPIQGFGINAAIGVVVAFFTIYGWLWAILPRFRREDLILPTREYAVWGRFMAWTYDFTLRRGRRIAWAALGMLAFCLVGISMIHTNYRIKNNLPRGQKITEDFLFFEEKFSGFRPVEVAVFARGGRQADDFEVLQQIDKVENHLRSYAPIKTTASIADVYRSLHAMHNGNRTDAYRLPDSLAEYNRYRRLADKAPTAATAVLISKDKSKARIAARMQDVGRDTVQMIQQQIEKWWQANTDPTVADFRITGTGVILDKNSTYIRDNMLQGLIPSVLIVALLMAFLFKDWRIVLVFMVPNVFPLFLAGAMIGYFGIPLEAGIATVFSIVFGIATDDTIHFLSAFKLCRERKMSVEESLRTTLMETGKAMTLGSIILFFSFLVMLFSIHPPSVIVGLLVSVTLAGALFCDLLLAPVLIRALIK